MHLSCCSVLKSSVIKLINNDILTTKLHQRAFENIHRYSKIGSVVHKVTPIVDDGEIISSCCVNTPEKVTLEKMFNSLKLTSRESWLVFLKEHIKMKEAVC